MSFLKTSVQPPFRINKTICIVDKQQEFLHSFLSLGCQEIKPRARDALAVQSTHSWRIFSPTWTKSSFEWLRSVWTGLFDSKLSVPTLSKLRRLSFSLSLQTANKYLIHS